MRISSTGYMNRSNHCITKWKSGGSVSKKPYCRTMSCIKRKKFAPAWKDGATFYWCIGLSMSFSSTQHTTMWQHRQHICTIRSNCSDGSIISGQHTNKGANLLISLWKSSLFKTCNVSRDLEALDPRWRSERINTSYGHFSIAVLWPGHIWAWWIMG